MLYHFASTDSLLAIQKKLNQIVAFANGTLDLSKIQDRDLVLTSDRWGTRDTAQNWGNNAWQFLIDFQKKRSK